MREETECLGVLIREIYSLFKIKPNERIPTNMFSLNCNERGYWSILVTDSWHKWSKKGLKLEYEYLTPEIACIEFLNFVKINNINVKSLQEKGMKEK